MHFVPNKLSHAKNGEPSVGVEDYLFDVVLFLLIADLYTPIKEYLREVYFEDDVPQKEQKHLNINSKPYTFYKENLYKLKLDDILQ